MELVEVGCMGVNLNHHLSLPDSGWLRLLVKTKRLGPGFGAGHIPITPPEASGEVLSVNLNRILTGQLGP